MGSVLHTAKLLHNETEGTVRYRKGNLFTMPKIFSRYENLKFYECRFENVPFACKPPDRTIKTLLSI